MDGLGYGFRLACWHFNYRRYAAMFAKAMAFFSKLQFSKKIGPADGLWTAYDGLWMAYNFRIPFHARFLTEAI